MQRGGMPPGAAHEIGDDHEIAVEREDAASMLGRRVSVVAAVEVVEAVIGAPRVDTRIRDLRPVKRSARQRLRPLVERQRVVQGR